MSHHQKAEDPIFGENGRFDNVPQEEAEDDLESISSGGEEILEILYGEDSSKNLEEEGEQSENLSENDGVASQDLIFEFDEEELNHSLPNCTFIPINSSNLNSVANSTSIADRSNI